ncbi:MAG: radical SAM protein, partial [Melioribacteraceae bacterium]|nr:radical SAM protein [Melioribacteraceae bacterium]
MKLIEAMEGRETTLSTSPLALAIRLEGRGCNLKCIYCSHIAIDGDDTAGRGKYAPGKILRYQIGRTFGTSETLISSVHKVAPYLSAIQFGGGEPLMYPEFLQVARIVKNYPYVNLSLCTNGNLINQEIIDEIIFSPNFRRLTISMDAATRETYSKIRKGGSFDKVLTVVREITQRSRNLRWPKIQFNFVIMRSNYKEVLPFVDLAVELGIWALNFMMLIPSVNTRRPEFYKRLQKEDLSRDKELAKEVLEIMQQVKSKTHKHGILLRPDRVTTVIYARYPELRMISSNYSRSSMNAGETNNCDIAISKAEDFEDSIQNLGGGGISESKQATKGIDWKNVFCHQPFVNFAVGHYRASFCCFAKP